MCVPVCGGVVHSTGSYASAPLLTPFQTCGVDDGSEVNRSWDPCCGITGTFHYHVPRSSCSTLFLYSLFGFLFLAVAGVSSVFNTQMISSASVTSRVLRRVLNGNYRGYVSPECENPRPETSAEVLYICGRKKKYFSVKIRKSYKKMTQESDCCH